VLVAARITWLDGLLAGSVAEVPLDNTLIEVRQLRTPACDPAHETAGHVEAPPCAVASEPVFDEARRVELDQLSVRSTLQAPKQPTPAQVMLLQSSSCSPLLKAEDRTHYAEPIIYAGHHKYWGKRAHSA
jgi:hypothetical protein